MSKINKHCLDVFELVFWLLVDLFSVWILSVAKEWRFFLFWSCIYIEFRCKDDVDEMIGNDLRFSKILHVLDLNKHCLDVVELVFWLLVDLFSVCILSVANEWRFILFWSCMCIEFDFDWCKDDADITGNDLRFSLIWGRFEWLHLFVILSIEECELWIDIAVWANRMW